mmetsp:Transcript_57770/g.128918  ORF Transcript_57770/g.128918 Transcript_57770/m.128918 type:complete len:252 (-) Transcript_57770:412-1167(-)
MGLALQEVFGAEVLTAPALREAQEVRSFPAALLQAALLVVMCKEADIADLVAQLHGATARFRGEPANAVDVKEALAVTTDLLYSVVLAASANLGVVHCPDAHAVARLTEVIARRLLGKHSVSNAVLAIVFKLLDKGTLCAELLPRVGEREQFVASQRLWLRLRGLVIANAVEVHKTGAGAVHLLCLVPKALTAASDDRVVHRIHAGRSLALTPVLAGLLLVQPGECHTVVSGFQRLEVACELSFFALLLVA